MTETTAKKPVRLRKAASDFNIAVPSVIEFLASKGIEIENNPNTKLSGEMYALLSEEFSQDKKMKEQSAKITIGSEKKEKITIEKPSPSLNLENEFEASNEILIKDSSVSNNLKEEEKAPEEPVKEEIKEIESSKEETETKPKVEKESEEPKEESTPKIEETETPIEEEEKESEQATEESPLKVVGKIDLTEVEAKRKKTGKKKKTTAKPSKEAKEEKPAEKTEVEKPKEETETTTTETKEESKEENEPKKIIRAKAGTLQGTTVIGKIDLTKFEEKPKKKKKPVASSSGKPDKSDEKKRKRRRRTSSGSNNAGANKKGSGNQKSRGGVKKTEPTDKEIQEQIKATMARLSGGSKFKDRSKIRKQRRDDAAEKQQQKDLEQLEAEKSILKLTEFITTSELAQLMEAPVNDVISKCFAMGMFVTINQRLDAEAITFIADEYGFDVEFISAVVDEPNLEEPDNEANTKERAPIVTIMGHVDHGKTSLLDYIRNANVIAGEAGGITQHIGAYEVTLENGKQLTFLDTPGHEAFTAMRARGAKVTDIVVIVIAADDNVMPQTKEAISHAQAAGVPIVFAFNKIDKPGADPDKLKGELSEMNILVEDWGGKYQSQDISAKNGTNVDQLLEKVLLEAELLELNADGEKRGVGTVIEAKLDKGKGVITTVLVQKGQLNMSDSILAGANSGRVKAMMNERGKRINHVGPSQPVQLLGFNGTPQAGDLFYVTETEQQAKDIATKRQQILREQGIRTKKHITLDEISRRLAIGDFQELNLIVKGDVDGSVEALTDSFEKLSTENIQVKVIHKAVGQISESDVLLASASNAIIIGFQVRAYPQARKLAEKEEIDIRYYSIIYDAINEVKSAMEGMLAPTFEEKIIGNVEVREVFKITKVGTIAGSYVLDGKINRNNKVRLIRDGVVIYTGELSSLKRFKDDVKEVAAGYECGVGIENYNDLKVGDIIEGFERVEVKSKL